LGSRGVFSETPGLQALASSDTDVESYRKWRYSNGVAEGEQEIEIGEE